MPPTPQRPQARPAPIGRLLRLDARAIANHRAWRRAQALIPPGAPIIDFGLSDPEFRRALERSMWKSGR